MVNLHIGFDDTDSPKRGCTTYIATILITKLLSIGVSFMDYPNLIRLNPNVPWKTRGNGALCLRVRCDPNQIDQLQDTVIRTIKEHADLTCENTHPGVVFLPNSVPRAIKRFATKTIREVVNLDAALRLIKKYKATPVVFKKGRGIIGALAAIGETLDADHTFELITYRTSTNCGEPRRLDAASIRAMNKRTWPLTFNNIDLEGGRILIAPRGPDPVLYGIRGENPQVVKQAHDTIRRSEPIERWAIFRTNHGTDAHLKRVDSIDQVQPYHSVIIQGLVADAPRVLPGRHVIFTINDNTGKIDCAAYEPTGRLRKTARHLIVGDHVEVYGGVRAASSKHPATINLEKLRILNLAPKITYSNPFCPHCRKRMKSMGRKQGFRCHWCGFRSTTLLKKVTEFNRDIREGIYVSPPRSQRHLTKPLCRYVPKRANGSSELVNPWHCP